MQTLVAAISRRGIAGLAVALALVAWAPGAQAAPTPAESFVSTNVQKGLTILNNHGIPESQKREQFEHFLLTLTDMKRIALFTLGQYRRGASQADLDQFASAFQNYALTVYQAYFSRYAGQTLQVTGSIANGAGDDIVRTLLVDPNDHSGQQPLEVDFRVKSDRGPPVVVDFSVGGVWLGQEERDQFTAFLGQNNGDIHALESHLGDLARNFRVPGQQR
jgi:phospholipid transport system substrate-binding protein